MDLTAKPNESITEQMQTEPQVNNTSTIDPNQSHPELWQEDQSMLQLDEPVLKFKFIANLKRIQLNSDRAIECIIKYKYKPFCATEVTTAPSFNIDPRSTSQ